MQYKVPYFFKLFLKILDYSFIGVQLFSNKSTKPQNFTENPGY